MAEPLPRKRKRRTLRKEVCGAELNSPITVDFAEFLRLEEYASPAFCKAFLVVLNKQYADVACIFTGKIRFKITGGPDQYAFRDELIRHAGISVAHADRDALNRDKLRTLIETCGKNFFLMQIDVMADLDLEDDKHANALIFNLSKGTVDHFEPHGEGFAIHQRDQRTVFNVAFQHYMAEFVQTLGFTYVPPNELCPRIIPTHVERGLQKEFNLSRTVSPRLGVQTVLNWTADRKMASPKTGLPFSKVMGTCAIWSLWAMQLRLEHPDPTIGMADLIQNAMDKFAADGYESMAHFIEHFIWKAYQTLNIRSYPVEIPLLNYLEDRNHVPHYATAFHDYRNTLPTLTKEYVFVKDNENFIEPLHSFLNINNYLERVVSDPALQEAIRKGKENRRSMWVPFAIPPYQTVADLPGAEEWGVDYLQFAQRNPLYYTSIPYLCACTADGRRMGCYADKGLLPEPQAEAAKEAYNAVMKYPSCNPEDGGQCHPRLQYFSCPKR